jgi:hypothetical protein
MSASGPMITAAVAGAPAPASGTFPVMAMVPPWAINVPSMMLTPVKVMLPPGNTERLAPAFIDNW